MKDRLELLANSIAFGRLQGLSDQEISKKLGKVPQYVTQMLRNNPALEMKVKELTSRAILKERNALDRLASIKEQIISQLSELAGEAVQVYADILKDETLEPCLKLKAAGEILDRLSIGRQAKLEISKGPDMALDQELIQKMKERLAKELQ